MLGGDAGFIEFIDSASKIYYISIHGLSVILVIRIISQVEQEIDRCYSDVSGPLLAHGNEYLC